MQSLYEIQGKLERMKNRNVDIEQFIMDVRHEMMKTYGWIPLEEFRKMSIPEFWSLWSSIVKDREMMNRRVKHGKR